MVALVAAPLPPELAAAPPASAAVPAPADGNGFAATLARSLAGPADPGGDATAGGAPTESGGEDAPPDGNGLPPWFPWLVPASVSTRSPATALATGIVPSGTPAALADGLLRATPPGPLPPVAALAAGDDASAAVRPLPGAAAFGALAEALRAAPEPTTPPGAGPTVALTAVAALPTTAPWSGEPTAGDAAPAATPAPVDAALLRAKPAMPVPGPDPAAAAPAAAATPVATAASALAAAVAEARTSAGATATAAAPALRDWLARRLETAVEATPVREAAGAAAAAFAPAATAAPAPHAAPTPAPAPLDAFPGTPAWREQLADRVSWLVDRDVGSAQLKLNPAHLGPVEIRIQIAQDQATVWFGAQHAATREALEAAAPRLRELLAGQGYAQVSVDVGGQASREPPRHAPRTDGAESFRAWESLATPAASAYRARPAAATRLDAYA